MATPQAISDALAAQSLPRPQTAWLSTLLAGQRPSATPPAILATAKHRLLALDLTTSSLISPPTASLPNNLSNPAVQELRLREDVCVQVLGIEDMSKSRWEQIESIEAAERGETTKGREIIRVVPEEDGENGIPAAQQAHSSSGPHKLVLQDWKGQRVFGIEMRAVPKVGLGMDIGTKVILKEGCTVARGMVLLEPRSAVVIGGKIDALHKAWLGNRKEELRKAIEAERSRLE